LPAARAWLEGAQNVPAVRSTIGTHDLLGTALAAEWLVSANAVVPGGFSGTAV
jgi:hypothetical protein